MRNFLSFLLLMVLVSGCSRLEVSVDYDDTYNFNKASTIVVSHENKANDNTLFSDRIIKALNSNLESKNYKRASEKEADLIFVFHTNVADKTQVSTEYISMGRGYRFGGMMASTSSYDYREGTIVIDALNPKTKKIVWRGIGTKELSQKNTPQEKTQAITRVIDKIMEKFPARQN